MDKSFFIQGFGNRFNFITTTIADIDDKYEEDLTVYINLGKNNILDTYAYLLAKLYQSPKTIISFDSDAEKLYGKYYNDKKLESIAMKKGNGGEEYTYIITLQSFALKYAGLHCLDRTMLECPDQIDNPVMNKYDWAYAIGMVERCLVYFKIMMLDWKTAPLEEGVRTDENKILHMIKAFDEADDGILTRGELSIKTNWSLGKSFDESIKTLEERLVVEKMSDEEFNALSDETKVKHGISLQKSGNRPHVYKDIR
jgi:hypothetical protein